MTPTVLTSSTSNNSFRVNYPRTRVCNVEHTLQEVNDATTSTRSHDSNDDLHPPSLAELLEQMSLYVHEFEHPATPVFRRLDLLIQLFRYFEKYFTPLCEPFAISTSATSTATQRKLFYQFLHALRLVAYRVQQHCTYAMEVYGMHIEHTIHLCDIVFTSAPSNETLSAMFSHFQHMMDTPASTPVAHYVGGPSIGDQLCLSLHSLRVLLEQLQQTELATLSSRLSPPLTPLPPSTTFIHLTKHMAETDEKGDTDTETSNEHAISMSTCSLSVRSSFHSIETNFSDNMSSEYGDIEDYDLELISL